ncbi:MAG TPA: ABC transporter permease [Conexibacter sp.]|jgi:ribose transport system permease protein|nr:ABC transporter permease [Conexibacter sp.]
MSADAIAPQRSRSELGARLRALNLATVGRQVALTVVAVGLFTYFSIAAPHFLSSANIFDMARVSAFLLIVAVPMTYLFIALQLDLSIGSVYGFCAVMMGVAASSWHANLWVAALVAVAFGIAVGTVNGFVTQVIGVPAFIATLAGFSLFRGLAIGVAGGNPISYTDASGRGFSSIANGTILGGVPDQAIWALAVCLLGGFVLRFTRFGAHIFATGGNETAAMATGIKTRRVKFALFVLSGASCGLIAALQGGWLLQGDPSTGSGFELQVIAAVIVGGVAITGGNGSIYGTLLGVSIIGMLSNGLVLLGVQANWQQFYVGLLIAIVAAAEVGLNRRDEVRRLFRRFWRSRSAKSHPPV